MSAAPKVTRKPKPKTNSKSEANASSAASVKERKPRKPAVTRAYNLFVTLEKKIAAINRNVVRWIAPEDETLAMHVRGLQDGLPGMQAAVSVASEHIGALYDLGFEVKAVGRGGRAPLAAGDAVVIRDNRYESEVHEINDYEVVAEKGRLFQIRSRVNPELIHYVPRAWIMHAPSAGAAD